MRPSPNKIFQCHNPKGIKLLTRLRLVLSHLGKYNFKQSFQDILNPLCSCSHDIETNLIIFFTTNCFMLNDLLF